MSTRVGQAIVTAHEWHRNGILRALFVLIALLCMVLGTGADSQWH